MTLPGGDFPTYTMTVDAASGAVAQLAGTTWYGSRTRMTRAVDEWTRWLTRPEGGSFTVTIKPD